MNVEIDLDKIEIYVINKKERRMEKQYRYDEIKEYFKNAIEDTEKIGNKLLMRMTLFSILDSMVQEYYNYPNKNTETFENFICKFSSISYLDKYDPITTYYEMKNKFNDIKSNLDYLEDAYKLYFLWISA